MKLVQVKQIEDESVEMYTYYFDTHIEFVKDIVDKNDLICSCRNMKKYLLEIENNKKMIKVMNVKEINVLYKGDINNMDHKAKIVEHEIKIKSKLEKVKRDKVENLSDGLLDWLTIIGSLAHIASILCFDLEEIIKLSARILMDQIFMKELNNSRTFDKKENKKLMMSKVTIIWNCSTIVVL
ncbi:20818_t:CDS:2 [Gigaspora margarita]|uniref:20818_t:CDS:1 n=1 Tax=Gigaspora margarita TaxID=4874 RepID=A0ABM8W145_GIGMA|nr:20818_t:CDS:2 [Gigaspora margarita]